MDTDRTSERAKLAQSLRDLASWIEQHDELPLPYINVGCWVKGETPEARTHCLTAFLAAHPTATVSGHTAPDGRRLIGLYVGSPSAISHSMTCTPEEITPEFFDEHFARFFEAQPEPAIAC